MTKESKLKIGLKLNTIAMTVSKPDFEKIKGKLKEIEDIIAKEPDEESIDFISRNDMLDAIGHGTTYTSEELQEIIRKMSNGG